MRTCSSDTALDQLNASDVHVVSPQAGQPESPKHQQAADASILATPPRKHVPRAASEPPGSQKDQAAKLEATRHALSERFPEVRALAPAMSAHAKGTRNTIHSRFDGIQFHFRLCLVLNAWLLLQGKMSDAMKAAGEANGNAPQPGNAEDAALCLPPLTFDYQLSSSYESPRCRMLHKS